jgi:hypothetical protein
MGVLLPVRAKAYFLSCKKYSDQLWGSHPVDNSLHSVGEVKNEWSFTLTPLACLLGVHMDGLSCTHLVSKNSQSTGVQRRSGLEQMYFSVEFLNSCRLSAKSPVQLPGMLLISIETLMFIIIIIKPYGISIPFDIS